MNQEIFDVVNGNDEVIDRRPRHEVHRLGLKHRAVHVLVFNARGEVFLQKRSMKKDTAAGLWDSSASGHLNAGEDYDAGAVRELREEIGLEIPGPPQRLFKIDAHPETGWEFCWVYRCEDEGPLELNSEEIEYGEWFAPAKITHWMAEKPGEFASSFRWIWKRFLTPDTPRMPGNK
jgi:isopentenyldiphosphate isomerase